MFTVEVKQQCNNNNNKAAAEHARALILHKYSIYLAIRCLFFLSRMTSYNRYLDRQEEKMFTIKNLKRA